MDQHNRYREEEIDKEQDIDEQSEESNIDKVQESNLEDNLVQSEQELSENNKKNKKKKKREEDLANLISYEELVKILEENKELGEVKDQLLRNRAELENFKKRMIEERIKERKYALQDFLEEFIDVIDIFDKAVNIQTEDEKLKHFLNGFVMVNSRMKQVLSKYEVCQIDALHKTFDPLYHSAVETVLVEGIESNQVVEVLMTGYMYKDRVLRPSLVKVSE